METKTKYALLGIAGFFFGYAIAYNQVKGGMCDDPNFITNIATYKAKCPNASWFDLMLYYSGQTK